MLFDKISRDVLGAGDDGGHGDGVFFGEREGPWTCWFLCASRPSMTIDGGGGGGVMMALGRW